MLSSRLIWTAFDWDLFTSYEILCSRYTNKLWEYLPRRKIRLHHCKVKLVIFKNLSLIEGMCYCVLLQRKSPSSGCKIKHKHSVSRLLSLKAAGLKYLHARDKNTNWPHGFQQGENTNAHTETHSFTCVCVSSGRSHWGLCLLPCSSLQSRLLLTNSTSDSQTWLTSVSCWPLRHLQHPAIAYQTSNGADVFWKYRLILIRTFASEEI